MKPPRGRLAAAHRPIENEDGDPVCRCGHRFTPGYEYTEFVEHIADAILASGIRDEAAARRRWTVELEQRVAAQAAEFEAEAKHHLTHSDRSTAQGQRHHRMAKAFQDKADGVWAAAKIVREYAPDEAYVYDRDESGGGS